MNKGRIVAFIAALAWAPCGLAAGYGTTAGETAKVTRVRQDSLGRVFVQFTQTPTAQSNTCSGGQGFASEQTFFDGTTLQGRILFNQALAAFASQSKVQAFSTGTCLLLVSGVPPFLLASRYEPLTSLTVFTP